jgi:hypothetical protein
VRQPSSGSLKTASFFRKHSEGINPIRINPVRVSKHGGYEMDRTTTALRHSGHFDSTLSGLGPGSMVMTMDGELPVEWLAAGDRVITRDAWPQ